MRAPTSSRSRRFYEKQSSGRYSVDGEVSEVTTVRYNEARYGRSNGFPCASNVCSNTWNVVRDGMTQWVADQKAAGQTDEQIKAHLATFDVLDRNDYDGDGVFDEPDGYLDRFQIVHAGGDQADGDPFQGEDAIWSHRWYVDQASTGVTGPEFNKAGGTQIGTTDLWVGDYTIQAENGGLSTIAHEYGHDLGLPDHYDTAASGDNPVSWWTLMAQSRVSAPGDQGIGTRAADLGVWDKLQLGWLDYETVVAGQKRTLELGPHEYNSEKAQGVAVVLPDKDVETVLPTPAEGERQWWSGEGDGYTAEMSRADIAVPAGGATLDLQLNYNIEEDYDYAYLEVESPAGSGNWVQLPTTAVDPDADADSGRDRDRRGQRRLRAGVLRPHAVRRSDHRPPGPLHHRRWRDGPGPEPGLVGCLHRRHPGHLRSDDRLRGRRREPAERLGSRRVRVGGGKLHHAVRPVLPGQQPVLRELRQVPQDRPVQLRVAGPA